MASDISVVKNQKQQYYDIVIVCFVELKSNILSQIHIDMCLCVKNNGKILNYDWLIIFSEAPMHDRFRQTTNANVKL